MAQMITVFGAVLGFTAALVGYFVFDISFLTAFAIWAVSGPIAAVSGFVVAGSNAEPARKSPASAFDAAA